MVPLGGVLIVSSTAGFSISRGQELHGVELEGLLVAFPFKGFKLP